MGGNSSRQEYLIEKQKLEAEALRKFNIRVKTYSYPHHGDYYDYIEWCRAQYEFDCIPVVCRQGRNYQPQYDNYGNQIY
jgi:hypothetical protein